MDRSCTEIGFVTMNVDIIPLPLSGPWQSYPRTLHPLAVVTRTKSSKVGVSCPRHFLNRALFDSFDWKFQDTISSAAIEKLIKFSVIKVLHMIFNIFHDDEFS